MNKSKLSLKMEESLMIVEEKPQLTKDSEPQSKEKEQTQIEVNEKIG